MSEPTSSWSLTRLLLLFVFPLATIACQDEGIHVTVLAQGSQSLQISAIEVSAEDSVGNSKTHRFDAPGAGTPLPLTLGLTFTEEARYPISLLLTAWGPDGALATGRARLTEKKRGEVRITVALECIEAGCGAIPMPVPGDGGAVDPSPDADIALLDSGLPELDAQQPDAKPDLPPDAAIPALSCHRPHMDEARCDDGNVCTEDVRLPTACGSVCAYRSTATVGAQDGCCPIGANPTSDVDCSAIERAPRSCLDIAQLETGAPNGLYEIDIQGKPVLVFRDMSSGTEGAGWTRVFRHALPWAENGECTNRAQAYFDDDDEAREANRSNPFAPKYSILSSLEHFRRAERLEFRINWPGLPERNVWSQLSNPTRLESVSGYKAISVQVKSNFWGCLERSALYGPAESSFIDGSIGRSHFFYAIGSKRPWANSSSGTGLPTWDGLQGWCEVELWVR